MCLLDDVVFGVPAPSEAPLEEAASPSFFGRAGSWNHNTSDHEMAAALLVLWRLFLSVGDKWGADGKPMTPAIDSAGWPLIERPTMSLKWPSPWRLWICVKIRRHQGELSKGHRLDRSYSSKWSNLKFRSCTNRFCPRRLHHHHPRRSRGHRCQQSRRRATERSDPQSQVATAPRNNLSLWSPWGVEAAQTPPAAIYGQGFNKG